MTPTNELSEKKVLGLWTSTALVVGNMIGSGVFLLPASLAIYGGISLFGWLFTATGAILLAITFSTLSRMMPRAGGPYAYTREGFGDFAGFIVAWGYWISILAGNAAIAVVFAGYLAVFWPAIAVNPFLAALVAIFTIWLLTWINILGVKKSGVLQLITTCLKLLPLIAMAIFGFFYFNIDHFHPLNLSGTSNFSAITATAALTLWAFLGLESATIPANKIKNPERTIPRATILGTIIAAIAYISSTMAVLGIVSPAVAAKSTAPFADAATAIWGTWAGYAVAAGAAVSCFGALNGWILLQGQMPLAIAKDNLFPASFKLISKRGTPLFGLIISSILVTILIAMNFTKALVELFTFIILLATITTLLPYVFCTMAELMIFIKEKELFSKKKLIFSSIITSLAFLYSIWAITGAGKDAVYWGFLLILAGIPIYVWIKWKHN